MDADDLRALWEWLKALPRSEQINTKAEFTKHYQFYRNAKRAAGISLPSPAKVYWDMIKANYIRFIAKSRIIVVGRNEAGNENAAPVDAVIQDDRGLYCHVCRSWSPSAEALNIHHNSVGHQRMLLAREVKNRREELESSKYGVDVTFTETSSLSFASTRPSGSISFHITNDGQTCTLREARCLPNLPNLSLQLHYADRPNIRLEPPKPFAIYSKKIYNGQVSLRPEAPGFFRVAIVLSFSIEGKRRLDFSIWKFVEFEVYDEQLREITKAQAPYERWRPPPRHRGEQKLLSAGTKPVFENAAPTKPLEYYDVPFAYRRILTTNGEMTAENKSVELIELEKKLRTPLRAETYATFFQTLLWAEELQMEIEIRRYDLRAPLQKTTKLLRLAVPGLAEKRPSVLLGDKVFVSYPNVPGEHLGYVHSIEQETVLLSFNASFTANHPPGTEVAVRFCVSRIPFRRMHEAVVCWSRGVPGSAFEAPLVTVPPSLAWFDPNLNAEQRTAVRNILTCSPRRELPYVVFGPPGTGKTVTIVEAIKQLWKLSSSTRILACAPSNAAADLLVDRLSRSIPKLDMFRLMAFQRSTEDVSETVKNYCCLINGRFEIPAAATLMKYRVVVSTCISAGILVASGLSDHFTHVFIDEAAQAPEPETLVAVSGIVTKRTRVVLAGDHRQLGPIIRSGVAKRHSLDRSLMERLCDTQREYHPDQNGAFPAEIITQLVGNYRSHRAILELPNRIMYSGRLIPMAEKEGNEPLNALTKSLLSFESFPVVWHGVEGKDEREGNSPSWFNQAEISIVIEWLRKLQHNPGWRVDWKQVGVITPYRKQAQKLRLAVEKIGIRNLKIGSVEEFQGEEKRVILISAVRSSSEYIDHDTRFALGFLQNPKRFNVAVTRAQALLIVIGNPKLLSRDEYWRSLLEYCILNGSYRGIEFELNNVDRQAAELLDLAKEHLDRNDEADEVEEDKEMTGGGFFEL